MELKANCRFLTELHGQTLPVARRRAAYPARLGVSATAGNAQASVSFTAPASNGGSAITSYTATSTPGSFTGTLTQAGSGTITVIGLTNGTAYTFTVTATKASGTGAASELPIR